MSHLILITDSLLLQYCFFYTDTATTEIYTLSLHDALPIYRRRSGTTRPSRRPRSGRCETRSRTAAGDRKSTRLNSSHGYISYAVFCLKKKINQHAIGLHVGSYLQNSSQSYITLPFLAVTYS